MRPPFFAFYPSDFADDVHVAAMSTLQVGAYLLLLCKAWQGEPPASLPNDDQILARFARVDAVVWAEIKAGVLVPFHVGADGRLHSKRLRREYDAALKRMRTAKESGRKGGKAAQGAVKAARAANSQGCLERPSEGGSSGGRALETGDLTVPSEQSAAPPPEGGATERPQKRSGGKKARKPPDPSHHPAVEAFCAAWLAKYGTRYPFNRGKDAAAVAFVLAALGGDLARYANVVRRFLADPDPFVAGNRHDLGTLRMKLPRWLADPPPAPARAFTPPPDFDNSPPLSEVA